MIFPAVVVLLMGISSFIMALIFFDLYRMRCRSHVTWFVICNSWGGLFVGCVAIAYVILSGM